MYLRLWGLLLFVFVFASGSAFGEDGQTFCRALRKSGLLSNLPQSGLVFYRPAPGTIALLQGEISKDVQQLYYYVRPTRGQAGQPSLLNIKYVFKSPQNNANSEYVQLRNDLWNLRKNRANRSVIVNSCSSVTVSGYERFHAQGSRDYCLQSYFHQRAPSLNTLDTDQRRRSFAFDDMVGPAGPGFGATLLSFFTPGAARAGELVVNRYSHVRSWIKNVKYQRETERCIAINTEFPEGVDSFQLRITNHGTQSSDYFPTRTWKVSFRP